MKKYLSKAFFVVLITLLVLNSYEIMDCIRNSFDLCINNLFPSLIPFMLLSHILLNYNFFDDISSKKNFLTNKFNISKNTVFIFIMSVICGTPANSIYINNYLKNKLIDIDDAAKCLNFCHFTNPIFIIGTIGISFLGSKSIGIKILISQYVGNIILGIIDNSNKQKENINKCNYKFKTKNKLGIFNLLKTAIKDISNTLLIISGVITFFLIISTLLNQILKINTNFKFIYGLIEITQGLKYLSLSNISFFSKSLIAVFLISFGGLSIHMQTFCILDNKKIRYLPYLKARLLHGIISCLILIILFNIKI